MPWERDLPMWQLQGQGQGEIENVGHGLGNKPGYEIHNDGVITWDDELLNLIDLHEVWICVLYHHSSPRTAGIRSGKCFSVTNSSKNMITYTVWKFRKSKITHQQNEIEQNLNRADLSNPLLSIRSCKNIQ